MDMTKFNSGDLLALDVYDSNCYGYAIGPNKAKFRFCLGEMHHIRNEQMESLWEKEPRNFVVVDLYLYGIKIVKLSYYSMFETRYSEVADFDEKNGILHITLFSEGVIEIQLGYESYKWVYVKEYDGDELTVEEEDRLANTMLEGEHIDIVWGESSDT